MIQNLSHGPQINQAVGQGLYDTLNPQIQRELAMQQTSRALGNLKQKSAGASPTDLLYNLIEASTLSPEIGRSLGPLYQSLLSQNAAGKAPEAINTAAAAARAPGSIGVQGNAPSSQIQQKLGFEPGTQLTPGETAQQLAAQKSGKEIQNLSNQYLRQVRPDLESPNNFSNIPTFDIAQKSALRPEEEANIRRDLNSQGVLPEQQNEIIAKINADIGNRYQEALKNFDIAQGQQNRVDQKWNTIKQDAPIQLKPFISGFGPRTQQILTDKYFQYANGQTVDQSPEQVESKAMALLQRDINQLSSLETLPAMPPFRNWGDAKTYMERTQKAYAPLKGQGFDQALLEDAIDNKDMGLEEAHQAIYGDQTDKSFLNSLSEVKKGDDEEKYINNIAQKLKKIGPNDDLVLARAMVLGSGGSLDDFLSGLDRAQKDGLELSPFQQGQLQEVQIPRQPPLWEIFSNQPSMFYIGTGGVGGGIFGHFFNYLRGKK